MALSNAERQRRHYEKQKEARKRPGDGIASLPGVRPFHEYYNEYEGSEMELPLRLSNIDPPTFDNDGPATFPDDLEGFDLPEATNSLERAELMVACFLDAASGLAELINKYKHAEIDRAMIETEADIVRLQKFRDQLEKPVRWTLPAWKVVG